MKYFFDTNIISNLINQDHPTIEKIRNISSDKNSEFYINRLVYMESLRAIPFKRTQLYKKTKETLNKFEMLDITQEIYEKSIKFARFCKSKGLNFGKCEAIDYIHFITAKHYKLEMISNDKDMDTMEKIYIDFLQNDNTKNEM